MSSGPSEPESPVSAGMRQLLAVVARLRAPDGCPWDREQTWASMAPHLLEEAFRMGVDAVYSDYPERMVDARRAQCGA